MQLCWSDADVNDEVVRIVIDDVYIITAPNPSYTYIIYLNDSNDEDSYITLKNAYAQGIVSRDDLVAIAAAETEHDSIKERRVAYLDWDEIHDVGEYGGYGIYFGRIGLYDKSYNGGRSVVITIDGVYICTVQDDMYDYFLYPGGEDEDPALLSEAYAYGLISYEDLQAIAEAEAEYLAANDKDDNASQWLEEQ